MGIFKVSRADRNMTISWIPYILPFQCVKPCSQNENVLNEDWSYQGVEFFSVFEMTACGIEFDTLSCSKFTMDLHLVKLTKYKLSNYLDLLKCLI